MRYRELTVFFLINSCILVEAGSLSNKELTASVYFMQIKEKFKITIS